MEVNYIIIGAVALGIILLIFWLVFRNQRDRKGLEKDLNRTTTRTEKHNGE
ncbi:hypothetical protein [Sphingobacterium suaedae]|uniref:LPXTG cell wall anchor domain-containing protein n=1 Tax=Sphingobacterium suaedae TaxID=1686402 RepID=A0ABW5KHI0_9SPHI